MIYSVGDKVIPVKNKLNGSGTWWECLLFIDGWNNLPENEKTGIIVKKLGNTYDVYFEFLKHLSECVWQDEIKLV